MTLDSTNRAWLGRYYKPKFVKTIDENCSFCDERLTINFFQDITGVKFCNRTCFNKTKAYRHASIFLLQKDHDKRFKHQADLQQKGR